MRIVIAASLLFGSTGADASTAKRPTRAPDSRRPNAGAVTGGGWIAHTDLQAVDDHQSRFELTFATRSTEARELTVPIAIPTGQVITGMEIDVGGTHLLAVATTNGEARGAFDDVVAMMKDPALLEWKDAHHVLLHVYPVSADERATVSFTFVAADTIEGHGPHLDKANSWIASPYYNGPGVKVTAADVDPNDPYADYWPSHD
jgi:hypothetical protein